MEEPLLVGGTCRKADSGGDGTSGENGEDVIVILSFRGDFWDDVFKGDSNFVFPAVSEVRDDLGDLTDDGGDMDWGLLAVAKDVLELFFLHAV